jgi:O-antigen/teichoic acid export membrane protein
VAVVSRLLKVGSMAESMTVYVPAMVLQKGVGLVRLLLLVHLLSRAEYGLWAVGAFLFDLATPVITLGSHHGLTRYVGFYEARGQVRAFYRRIRWPVLGVCVALGALAFAASGPLARHVVASRADASSTARHLHVCWAALGNALVMALYLNLLSFLYGLRTYRLIAALEVLFSVGFTVLAVVVVMGRPTGLAVLLAHSAAVAAALVAGLVLLRMGLRRPMPAGAAGEPLHVFAHPSADADESAAADALPAGGAARPVGEAPEGVGATFGRILRYGLVALVSNVLWNLLGYVSYYLTHRRFGGEAGGTFQAFMRLLGQPVMALSSAAWAVVFTHVVHRWEDDRQRGEQAPAGEPSQPVATLQTAYKAVALGLMTVGVLLYVTAPLWIRVMPAGMESAGRALVPGLLMFFQSLAHLALLTMLAKLRERPAVIAVAAVAGAAANVALALWWMPLRGPAGAALAAGVGMYLGGGAVAAGYFLLARVRMQISTLFVLTAPVLFLAPAWAAGPAWALVLLAAWFTRLLFADGERGRLRSAAKDIRARLRPARGDDAAGR